MTERLDKETFNKGTTLIANFNPGIVFANDTLDAWFSELKHLEPLVFMIAIRHICRKVKWYYSTNLVLEIGKVTADILSQKSRREEPVQPEQTPTQRERNRKFLAYMHRALTAHGRMNGQLVQDVVDGKKDISAFETEDLLPVAEGYPASWNEI